MSHAASRLLLSRTLLVKSSRLLVRSTCTWCSISDCISWSNAAHLGCTSRGNLLLQALVFNPYVLNSSGFRVQKLPEKKSGSSNMSRIFQPTDCALLYCSMTLNASSSNTLKSLRVFSAAEDPSLKVLQLQFTVYSEMRTHFGLLLQQGAPLPWLQAVPISPCYWLSFCTALCT